MVETQATARVDRLDEKMPIHIYRYIVKESIEEVCYWLNMDKQPWLTNSTESPSNAKEQDPIGRALQLSDNKWKFF